MKTPFYALYFGLLMLFLTACTDSLEEDLNLSNGINPNRLVPISLPVNLSQPFSAEIVTRATPEETKKHNSQVAGIMLFVYEKKGGDPAQDKLINWQLFGMSPDTKVEGETGKLRPDKNNPNKGYIDIFLPEGEMYIYLIANAKNSFVDFFWYQKIYDPQNLLQNRKLFLESIVPKWNGNIHLVSGYLPMCGMVNNDDGACKVTIQHKDPNNQTQDYGMVTYVDKQGTTHTISGELGPNETFTRDNAIVLQRLMSKVSMHFKNGPNVKFKPLTYHFHHCAEYISPVKGFWQNKDYKNAVLNTEEIPFDTQTPMDFEVYLPENICPWPAGQPVPQSFQEREAILKNPDGTNQTENGTLSNLQAPSNHQGHYLFKNAPPYATYVEVTGRLEDLQQNRSAEVRYLIHLGDFSQRQWQNYSLERDWQYTYNVTVNGAREIVVEVLGESGGQPQEINPVVEGVVFQDGIRLELDAHYEQVEMRYQKDELNTLGDVYIYADTPYGHVHCKYRPGKGNTPGSLVQEGFVNQPSTKEAILKLLQWVEFKPQNRKGELAVYEDNVKRMNVFEVLDHAFNQTTSSSYYTCFVDEYFYDQHPVTGSTQPGDFHLKQFINAAPRTFSIGSNIHYSADKQSAVAHAVYMFKQRSIACFYDLNDTRAKYGVELIDEINLSYGAGKMLPYGTPRQEGTDVKDGLANSLKEISDLQRTPVVNWKSNGYLLSADDKQLLPGKARLLQGHEHGYKACLIRNRDFNGNGFIDNHELRWYTPARDQLLGLWIGEPAMPAEAALYPYPTTQLSKPASGSAYPILSSSGGNNRVIWAEEGSTFGDENSAPYGGYIRVVRNLGTGNFSASNPQKPHEVPADPFYDYDPATRCITLHLTPNALRAYSSHELAPHHERSLVNRPYRQFQVAQHPYTQSVTIPCKGHTWVGQKEPKTFDQLQTNSAFEAKEDPITLAANYQQPEVNAAQSKADWRLPNQRELALMIVAMGNDWGFDMEKYNDINYGCSYWGTHQWRETESHNILHCRTKFSNSQLEGFTNYYTPHGYIYNMDPKKRQMQMTHNDFGMGTEGKAGYLCVRDVR